MVDLPTPQVRFDGLGVTAAHADEGAQALAERLNLWSTEHPNRRILELRVQCASTAARLELTAVIAYLDEFTAVEASAAAEEIVADAQQEPQ